MMSDPRVCVCLYLLSKLNRVVNTKECFLIETDQSIRDRITLAYVLYWNTGNKETMLHDVGADGSGAGPGLFGRQRLLGAGLQRFVVGTQFSLFEILTDFRGVDVPEELLGRERRPLHVGHPVRDVRLQLQCWQK